MKDNYIVKGYQPEALFRFFEDLCAIPHGSGNESGVADYLERFAKQRGLFCLRDKANNVFIRKNASPGYEHRGAVLLQGHTDMVCEKNSGTSHDFLTDALTLYIDDTVPALPRLKARGTTLGADDGAAVAVMLALLDDGSVESPALECLFTVEEETTMRGANSFDYSVVTSRTLINLDGEEDGIAWASCAGGIRAMLTYRYDVMPFSNKALKIQISGLAGGHSGVDADKCRANANKLMGRLLANLYQTEAFNLISISGGNKLNAIPRECEAQISVLDPEEVTAQLLALEAQIRNELCEADRNFKIRVGRGKMPDFMMTYKSTSAVTAAIALCPNGVLSMSSGIPGLVESSANLGVITTDDAQKTVTLGLMNRSSQNSIMNDICLRFAWFAKVTGAEIIQDNRYPGWAFDKNSRLQQIYRESYAKLFPERQKPEIAAIHAGLECGIIIDRLGGNVDAICIGPLMKNVHTPEEFLDLKSMERFWLLITDMLKR